MKKFSIYLLSILMIVSVFSCADSSNQQKVSKTPEANITTVVNPADGLDLKLVGSLLQKGDIKNASDLEKALNKEGGINNLDLDSDNKVDFINVSENDSQGNSKIKSFDLTTGKDDNLTYLATIEVEKGQESYNINLSGSETIYGQNSHYSSSHSLSSTDMLLMYWMFSSNRPMYYHSPYHYGSYPSYYSQPRVVNQTTYVNRTVTQRNVAKSSVKKSSTPYKSKVKSSNVGKVSKKTRTSISNHNKAQKSFKARDKNKTVKKTGFTKSNTTKKTTTKKKTIKKPKKRSSTTRSRSRSRSRRPSDGTFKVDVVDLDNSLNNIKKLNGVTYYWDRELLETSEDFREFLADDCEDSQQVGFIAQEVEKVFPLLVDNTHGYGKKVDYELMVVYLVEAIKEQQKMIDSQQEQINNLTNNIK